MPYIQENNIPQIKTDSTTRIQKQIKQECQEFDQI